MDTNNVAEANPIKQGLKLQSDKQIVIILEVAEANPIKQGLKHRQVCYTR